MKKIIVLIILVAVVGYFISSDLSGRLDGANNAAQAAQASSTLPTGYPKVTYYKKQTILQNNRGAVNFYTYLNINAAAATTITLGLPLMQKDGQTFTSSSSNFKISAVQVRKRGMLGLRPTGNTMNTQPLSIAKGANTYLVSWTIDSALLPNGSYTFSLSNYTSGNSTSTVVIEPVWSSALVISDDVYRRLHGMEFRLQSYNGKTFEDATSTPHISFAAGQMYAKFCGISSGIYQIVRERLVATLKGSQPNCGDTELNKLEKDFILGVGRYGIPAKLEGDTLKLNFRTRGYSMDATFIKWTPQNASSTVNYVAPKIYPCDFVGPIEANAVRDCGLGLGVSPNGGFSPTLTSMTPVVVARGSVVTITGTNFATSNVILFSNISGITTEREVATVLGSASSTSIQFTVPSQYSCPLITSASSPCTPTPLAAGTYSVRVKTPNGPSMGALTLVVQ